MPVRHTMEWFEDPAFWETFFPYIFSDERLRFAPDDVERVITLVGAPAPQDVLDLACGTGRHAAAFARKGWRVTGVDRTRAALDAARTHAEQAGLDIEFVECDMREFRRPASFDLIVNLFTSFGYFEDPADDVRVLRNMHEALRPGGALVIDVMGKEVLARVLQETRSTVASDGTLMIWRTATAADWTRVNGEWYAIKAGIVRSFRVDHSIYSGAELRALLGRAGFSGVRLYGDLDAHEYGIAASRLVAVARK
ncbi:MAG TPA: class I SAM-dependent methyltransferase [Vicinamibacterales bacterium]|nr:class I SAM-dependent methyltransferase [Vicinamibacterales bacterium]